MWPTCAGIFTGADLATTVILDGPAMGDPLANEADSSARLIELDASIEMKEQPELDGDEGNRLALTKNSAYFTRCL